MKDVVINVAGNIAFDPGQVIPCHAVQLLGGKRSCGSCIVILEEMGVKSDGRVSRRGEGRCPVEVGTFVPLLYQILVHKGFYPVTTSPNQ